MQWCNHWYVARCLLDCGYHSLEEILVGDESLAVDGQYEILVDALNTCRSAESRMVVSQGVDKQVAYHINLVQFGSLACGNTVGVHSRGEHQVAESVDNEAVYFFRHIDVERACASHEMSQTLAALLADDGNSHGGGKVVAHDDCVCGYSVEIVVEGSHHPSCQFVDTLTIHSEVNVGVGDFELFKQVGVNCRVALATRIY